ncbi:MAG: hypothetical protein OTJ97_07820 [SAR202 cluster bacterium]|nr:hypothetical protein [SAR202 cluster bacterium]
MGASQHVKGIAELLRLKAAEMWGEKRASALAGIIEQTANDIWRVERRPESLDEEPETYP